MSTEEIKSKFSFENIVAAFFTPGQVVSRFTQGVCFGIILVGLMNIVFTLAIDVIAAPTFRMDYGVVRTTLFFLAISYVGAIEFLRRSLNKKNVNVGNQMNAESGSHKAVRHAA